MYLDLYLVGVLYMNMCTHMCGACVVNTGRVSWYPNSKSENLETKSKPVYSKLVP